MADHCDNCGTELDPDNPRHQRFLFEAAEDDTETMTGALCSDCFFEFQSWLETKDVAQTA
jgi:methionyl-tRNA synthetase